MPASFELARSSWGLLGFLILVLVTSIALLRRFAPRPKGQEL
jgi:hypothetical protein